MDLSTEIVNKFMVRLVRGVRMNEQNEQIDNCFDGDEVVKEFFKNKLKNVSTRVIEETIAKTICELIGEELECRISDIKYGDGFTSTYAKLDVSFTRILK